MWLCGRKRARNKVKGQEARGKRERTPQKRWLLLWYGRTRCPSNTQCHVESVATRVAVYAGNLPSMSAAVTRHQVVAQRRRRRQQEKASTVSYRCQIDVQ